MANSYSQLYVHLVFAVKYRAALIPLTHKEELHRYIGGTIKHRESMPIAINSMPDHIHILLSLHPKIALADLIRDVKANSSGFIKDKGWIQGFAWQEGYGAFTCSESQKQSVIAYIEHQEEHHRKRSFREEYIEFLKAYHIEYDERYIFHDPE